MQMSEKSSNLMEQILKGSSTDAVSWWKTVNSGAVILSPDFDWYLLASGIVTNAYRYAKNNDEESSLKWAELAISVEAMLAKSPEEYIAHACEMTAMTLRAKMICKFGYVAGHSVLDSDLIFKWFYEKVPFSSAEMIEREQKWWQLNNEERVRILKDNPAEELKTTYLKNRLTVIDILEKCGRIPISNDLIEWLKARKVSVP